MRTATALSLTMGTPVPVSYTHLDVYKRQMQETLGEEGYVKAYQEKLKAVFERHNDLDLNICLLYTSGVYAKV